MVPANVDLTELPRCQFAIEKLCFSRFTNLPAEAFKAAVLLYARSYREAPAGSLPGDDEELAGMANLGGDVARWAIMKARVLEGWEMCADGRYYRKDLSILVLSGWMKRLISRRKSAAANAGRRKAAFDAQLYDRDIAAAAAALYSLSPYEPILRGYKNADPDIEPDDDFNDDGAPSDASSIAPTTPKRSEAKAKQSESSYASARDAERDANPKRESAEGGEREPCQVEPAPQDQRDPDPWPSLEAGFPLFFGRYPNAVDEEGAKLAYDAAREGSGIAFEAMLGRVEAYARHKPPKQEWLKPANWLKGRRWRDRWPAEAVAAGFCAAKAGEAPPSNPRAPEFGIVFVAHGSPQWRAWQSYGEQKRGHGFRGYPVTTHNGIRGWHFVTAWPPGSNPHTVPKPEPP